MKGYEKTQWLYDLAGEIRDKYGYSSKVDVLSEGLTLLVEKLENQK